MLVAFVAAVRCWSSVRRNDGSDHSRDEEREGWKEGAMERGKERGRIAGEATMMNDKRGPRSLSPSSCSK